MNKLILASLILILFASCNSTKEPDDKKAALENGIREQVKFLGEPEVFSSITNRMSEYNIPALSLAVIKHGEIEWADIYRNANFPEEHHLNSSSIFQAASLSKPVTFLAALRMYSAGKIDLDKNIQEYLKDFVIPQGKQTAENPVTFRNIFSHTSGISPGGYQGYTRNLPMPSDLDILRGSEGVNTPAIEVLTPPKKTLAYSGGGYTLAELALQDIFNDEFSNIMQKWILEPAGMKHSEFTQPLPASDSIRVANGYTQSGEVIEGGWRNYPQQAAAGLWSNSIDLANFLIEIYKAYQGANSIFSQSDIKSIISQERDGSVYGFILNRSGDDISITHFGGNAGYRTGMTISLTSGNGLAYLINSDNGGALGNELLLSASQIYNWHHFKQTEAQRTHVKSDVLKGLSGSYKWNNQIDLTVSYDENKDQISLFFPNGDEYKLVPVIGENLDFIHPNTGVQISFTMKDNIQSFTLYGQNAIKL
ncbi:serine hydrolase domain-containing protein [Draconibacterium sp. IB214405]|uniref:serine hydrolase domain-containing protein n=1 Tax=Draconibacterium sp. IB214405 TaxID=3097352 RepID=UPI002A11026C|nr:serine hydrolase domain-containing protein [Draconibacterium sp. IB214405]MDX8340238.1 serine hydrolase domain-containing protein [Draconibacterium sp. IB214405]